MRSSGRVFIQHDWRPHEKEIWTQTQQREDDTTTRGEAGSQRRTKGRGLGRTGGRAASGAAEGGGPGLSASSGMRACSSPRDRLGSSWWGGQARGSAPGLPRSSGELDVPRPSHPRTGEEPRRSGRCILEGAVRRLHGPRLQRVWDACASSPPAPRTWSFTRSPCPSTHGLGRSGFHSSVRR